jgi:aspartyl-tRNA(Asn)/glutamyl-tRNA(Gln) amidotransferase subunit A
MPMSDLTELSIAQAAEAIARHELSPVALTEAYLRRIEKVDGAINAYITVSADRARADAQRAEAELSAGNHRGPLHGIPVALKDIVDTDGLRTTSGSRIFGDYLPAADASVARQLAEAGSVLLGKLNMHEFALGGTTNNPHYGATRNPWDLSRIPGGSSGGSGAAVTARLTAGAIGTDTAGSIRIPSALCGGVGLKPTYGRVSKRGVTPLSPLYDHVGPMTRTVEDAAIILQAIAGYDAKDPHSLRVPVDDYRAQLKEGVRGLRVAIAGGMFASYPSAEVREAIAAAARELAALGAEIVTVDLGFSTETINAAIPLYMTEALQFHRPNFTARPDDYGADLHAMFSAPPFSMEAIGASMAAVDAVRATFASALEDVDVIISATVALGAPPIGAETVVLNGEETSAAAMLVALTMPGDLARVPVMTLPCGFTGDGLPIGLSIAGKPFDEATVLRTGFAYEQAAGWYLDRPTDPAE